MFGSFMISQQLTWSQQLTKKTFSYFLIATTGDFCLTLKPYFFHFTLVAKIQHMDGKPY